VHVQYFTPAAASRDVRPHRSTNLWLPNILNFSPVDYRILAVLMSKSINIFREMLMN